MDFPVFHMDYLNNRFLIGSIAALHVLINHALAVGGIPIVVFMEYYGFKVKDQRWEKLAYQIMTVFFIVTTTIGAMTGVGIWFSAALVNPTAIGSLIRVFFSAWFTEWIVFVTEVCLIMLYYLTWKKWQGQQKKKHIWVGVGLAAASWLTMVIIVAILGFMMDPGSWLTRRSFLSGFFNPAYVPQLFFRTPLAMIMAGAAALAITFWAARKDKAFRQQAVRLICFWQLIWLPHLVIGSVWYAAIIPEEMIPNMAVANATAAFSAWYDSLKMIIALVITGGALLAIWGVVRPRWYPGIAYILPIIGLSVLLSHFERVREFIRKPYAIGNYLYSNAIRVADYPLLQRDGILKYATYVSSREITKENEQQIGKELFMLTCSRCHTLNGVNRIAPTLKNMYGSQPWDETLLFQYLENMHNTRPFMPPFPGNAAERRALAKFLVSLQTRKSNAPAAQINGVVVPEALQSPTAIQNRRNQ